MNSEHQLSGQHFSLVVGHLMTYQALVVQAVVTVRLAVRDPEVVHLFAYVMHVVLLQE